MSACDVTPAVLHRVGPDALLDELDAFFSQGTHTDRVRRFIEEHEHTFALVATVSKADTDTEGSLQLYQLFRTYASLIDDIVADFAASHRDAVAAGTASILGTLATAVQREWATPTTAYRCLCTAYIAAAMDYMDFLEFAEDLYAMTHGEESGADEESDTEDSSGDEEEPVDDATPT
ncbi:hypothetical protein NESM_000146800 [Novymonas esmeraldas]|uniref:Uncharacterized protein n=1 Tax=Novymonas esmeraldas TaxID=1808958 RepID=A0AAW0F3X2_9TRYP